MNGLERPIGIAGAGSIGCFVGGMLAASGRKVALLTRPRLVDEIRRNGLRLTAFDGSEQRVDASRLLLSDDPAILGDVGVVLVAVKSADTGGMVDIILAHAPADAAVVSLQNGVGNVALLRRRLPGRKVLGGMVSFNVVSLGDGRFHRSTSGAIVVAQDADNTARRLSAPGLAMRATDDIDGVQWGKLVVNLNNALNALSDVPLRQQLAERNWRRLFADQMAEGLAVIKAEGIKPVSPTPLPAWLMPPALRLPDAVFNVLLGRSMKIDPQARSSMWEDLARRRRTEIDYLQGVISAIAERRGLQAPLSQRIVALVKQAEAAEQGPPGLTPEQIRGLP